MVYQPTFSSPAVTHGCIIATIRLYINDVELPGLDPPIHQVMQIVQSALSHEQELENKLASMQEVLNAARQLASESMIVSNLCFSRLCPVLCYLQRDTCSAVEIRSLFIVA